MERFFEKQLKSWKEKVKPLPLMLVGERQTGKTYLLQEFCRKNFRERHYKCLNS